MTNKMMTQVAVLTFVLGTQEYALLIEDVVEVAALVEIVVIPDPRPEILGVVNRHGELLLMVDLRRVFNQPPQPLNISTLFIVVRRGDSQIGLIVDEVRQVEYIDPMELTYTGSEPLHGIISLEQRVVQVISVSPLLTRYTLVSAG